MIESVFIIKHSFSYYAYWISLIFNYVLLLFIIVIPIRPSPSSRCHDATAIPAPARLPEEEDEAGSEDTHEEELLDHGRPGIDWEDGRGRDRGVILFSICSIFFRFYIFLTW